MDHNLEDSLNLESAMESMDFDSSEVVVSQADITLESNPHDANISMEFGEQQMLMETGNEEIIDFIGEQFTLQGYSVQDDQGAESTVAVELNPMSTVTSPSETMIDLQLDTESIPQTFRQRTAQPQYISVKSPIPAKTLKRTEVATVPRQVAIAPKPPKLQPLQKATFASGKQYTIAPKPVALVMNKSLKKVSLAGVQGTGKGNTVITSAGKQYVMVPTEGNQKIKLVSARSATTTLQCVPSSSDQAQLISSKSISASQLTKPVITKVIVQGQTGNAEGSNQPAVIRKILPASNSGTQARYVMQQKTIPIFLGGNKVLLTSPSKQGVKVGKKQQIIAIKSSPQKILPVTQQGTGAKKVVITANQNQNVILKTTAPPKGPTVSKDGNVVLQGQRTQLHQINVPGKGIQYIRLVTNATSTATSTSGSLVASSAGGAGAGSAGGAGGGTGAKSAPAHKPAAWPAANTYITDNTGKLIQMTAEKATVQPPPLVITGTTSKGVKQERKLVRIAPVNSNSGQILAVALRSSQSLLAPVSTAVKHEESLEPVHQHLLQQLELEQSDQLQQLDQLEHLDQLEPHADTAQHDDLLRTIDIKYERAQSPVVNENSKSRDSMENKQNDHPLIVIPSTFKQNQPSYSDDSKHKDGYSDDDTSHLVEDPKSLNNMLNVEAEIVPYQSPQTPQANSESDLVTADLGLRPRKACNCTKSQCLKLYCDCFANGEFCNRCNCNNCHNNLDNEELRQKAIRACLDRNPNAFRPKIGKAKSGGPEIIRRHNKGCNCKRSGCLKNYCECYEAKIACTAMCKCVGCRNVEETLERRRDMRIREKLADPSFRPAPAGQNNFMTAEVIEAVCQCLVAAAVESAPHDATHDAMLDATHDAAHDPMRDVINEFARCLTEIIGASHHAHQENA